MFNKLFQEVSSEIKNSEEESLQGMQELSLEEICCIYGGYLPSRQAN